MSEFYKIAPLDLYGPDFIPTEFMTLTQLDKTVTDSLVARVIVQYEAAEIYQWKQEKGSRQLKASLKIASVVVIAVAGWAVVASGSSAAGAGAISAETGTGVIAATEIATVGEVATATQKALAVFRKVQSVANYVQNIAGVTGMITGNTTALKLANLAGIINQISYTNIISDITSKLIKDAGFEIGTGEGVNALKERIYREQQLYAMYLEKQAALMTEIEQQEINPQAPSPLLTTEEIQTKKGVQYKELLMLATPFLLLALGG